MARRLTPLNIVMLLALCLSLALVGNTPAQAQAPVNPHVISVFGSKGSLLVHAWVVVPPGADANAVAANALAAQGARRISSSKFATEGLNWPQFTDANPGNDYVSQYYNPASDPTQGGGGSALTSAENTWTAVASSRFVFQYQGTTTRCPSLVNECPGAQYLDGFNDVAWMALGGCCTLGVTWYSTSGHEADMALNINFPWSTSGGGYDAQTVFLHEDGHVAGLAHSNDINAVMYPSYQGIRRALGQDDINGITALYPLLQQPTTGGIQGHVTDTSTTNPIPGATVSVDSGQSATTDTNGFYSMTDVPTGNHTVAVSASGYGAQSATVAVNDSQTTTQDFGLTPTTGSVSGTVTNSSTGLPISGASISADTGQSTTTNSSGGYLLSNVPTGSRTVTASAGGYVSQSDAVTVNDTQNTPHDFALAPATGSISGSVIDASSLLPISGATVSLDTGQSTNTNTSGGYSFGGVAAGSRSVSASASGYSSQSKSVNLSGGQTATVNFSLSSSAPPASSSGVVSVTAIDYRTSGGRTQDRDLRVAILLEDDQGAPVGGASISLSLLRYGSLYQSYSGTTSSNGTVTFTARRVLPGTYTTVVNNVNAAGLTWDGVTTTNSFTK